MMELYFLKIDSMEDPLLHPEWREWMTEERQEKISRLSRPEDRAQCAAAGILLFYGLKKWGISDIREGFYVDGKGKPCHKQICFNLSHSGSFILCALSEHPVGCDIERIRYGKERLVYRFFSEQEQAYVLAGTDEEERARRFTRVWTLIESYAKLTGEGLLRTVDKISWNMEHDPRVFRNGICQNVEVFLAEKEDYMAAVCGEEPVLEVSELDFEELFLH